MCNGWRSCVVVTALFNYVSIKGVGFLQILLVVSGGASLGRLPVMALAFFVMLRSWLVSVRKLATFTNCSMTHVESTIEESDNTHDRSKAAEGPASTDMQVIPL